MGKRIPKLGASQSIRAANRSDIPALLVMAEHFFADDGPYAGKFRLDPASMASTFARLIADHQNSCLFVLKSGDELVGALAGMSYPSPATGELIASELFFWIEPEHRGHGGAMLELLEAWARLLGAAKLIAIAPNDRVSKLYERRGFPLLERHHCKDL